MFVYYYTYCISTFRFVNKRITDSVYVIINALYLNALVRIYHQANTII